MRKLIGSAVVVAALAMAGASAVAAQSSVTYGVAGGVMLPMGDYGTADKLGFTVGAGASLGIGTSPVRVRVEGSYGQSSHDGVGGNTKIAGGMASLVYPFQTAGAIKPYVLGGVGYYNVKVDVTGLGSASESKVGFGGGVGVMFGMGSANLFAEGRYISISTSGSSTTFVPLIVGIRFGGK